MVSSNPRPSVANRRLHPVSVLYFLIHSGKELAGLLPLIPFCIFLIHRVFGKEIDRIVLTVCVIVAAAIMLVVFACLRWRRFMYRVEDGVLYIEHGLWVRRKIWITRERIQSLDVTVSLYDRIFGLVRLEMETSGGDEEPEAVLSSISAAEAVRIQREMGMAEPEALTEIPGDSPVHNERSHAVPLNSMRLSLGQTLILSTTSGKFAVLWMVIVGGGLKLWDEWVRDTPIWDQLSPRLLVLGIPGLVVILALLSWLLAFAAAFLFESGFQVETEGRTLTIERGILEKKRTVIKPHRIQAVRITQNPLHKLFGRASVRMVIAGSSDEDKKVVDLFPLVRYDELPMRLEAFLPGFRLPKTWSRVGRQSYRSYTVLPVLICILLAAAVWLFVPGVWRWLAWVLPFLAWGVSSLEYRKAAWSREENQLHIRYGSFSEKVVLIPISKVQWHKTSQTPFQAGKELATLKVAVASGKSGEKISLRHASAADVHMITDWLSGK
ncbi:PH domain-containing protein [Paenibacillus sp. XY044]|uniref:PH domain-containing protein n=1 Tax=Paenibacillus sp. XY044 TaxID=2026089 RepID=UPI0015C674DD|nr:PH domain-containing protein [Paenibacillus sp. XY044]